MTGTASVNQGSTVTDQSTGYWPGFFSVGAHTAFLVMSGVVGAGLVWFVLYDLIRVFGPVEYPMWVELFAMGRPFEWLQWFVLVTSVVLAGFLSGKLVGGPARFFLLMAISLALIFLEDASHMRFILHLEYTSVWFGQQVAGVPSRIAHDIAFSALIMVVPLYTLLRYARHIWSIRSARGYLIAGFGLYACVLVLAALRHVDGLYVRIGEAVDTWLFRSRWTASPQVPDDMLHFYVVDAALRETMEVFGAACFLAMILACAEAYRRSEAGE